MRTESRIATHTAPWRIVTVDDHEQVRGGLRAMLDTIPGIQVVAAVANGVQAVATCRELKPDLLLCDMKMPIMDGPTAIATLKQTDPEIPCLVLSAHSEMTLIYDALRAGAAGYVLKEAPIEDLVDAIGHAITGEPLLDVAEITEFVTKLANDQATMFETTDRPEWMISLSKAAEEFGGLEPRELEVLVCMGKGWTNPEIGRALSISRYTVNGYVESIFRKMRASDRTYAVARALGIGILTQEMIFDREPQWARVPVQAHTTGPNEAIGQTIRPGEDDFPREGRAG